MNQKRKRSSNDNLQDDTANKNWKMHNDTTKTRNCFFFYIY